MTEAVELSTISPSLFTFYNCMKTWSRCFGMLLQSHQPQERTLSCLIVTLAIAYVGLTWTGQSSSCAEASLSRQISQMPIQLLSCE